VVSQSSGEDWSDVALTLSTARPGGQAEAPVLPPLILRIARPQPVGQARMRGAPSEADAEVAAAPMMEPALGAGMPKQASERLATLETRGFDIVYRIPGHVTVSGDGTAKTLKVASQSIDPELVVRAVPALDPTAYLTVRFANDGSGPILPGPVQLFRDGVFVGRSTVRFIAPKEEAVFGFGADPAVVVERVTLERSEGERGVLSTDKVDQRRFKITVTNRHERPMTVEIEDRLPQSENEKITVQPVETTEPSARDPQGRRGVLVWKEVYAANESREILIGYVVRWPEGERVIWQDRGER